MNIYNQFGKSLLPTESTQLSFKSHLEVDSLNEKLILNGSHAAGKRLARARSQQEKKLPMDAYIFTETMDKFLSKFCLAIVNSCFYNTTEPPFLSQLNIANSSIYDLGKYLVYELGFLYDTYMRRCDKLIVSPLLGLLEQLFYKNEKLSAEVSCVLDRIISMVIVINTILVMRYKNLTKDDNQGFTEQILSNNLDFNRSMYGSNVVEPEIILIAQYQRLIINDSGAKPIKEFDESNPFHGKSELMYSKARMLATLRSQLQINRKKTLLQNHRDYVLWILLLYRGRLNANNNNFEAAFRDFNEARLHISSLTKYGIILPQHYLTEYWLIARLQQHQHGEVNYSTHQSLFIIFREAENLINHMTPDNLLWPLGEHLMRAVDRMGKLFCQKQEHYLAGLCFSFALKVCKKLFIYKRLEEYTQLETVLTKFIERCSNNNIQILRKALTETTQPIKIDIKNESIIFTCENITDLRLLTSVLKVKNITFSCDKKSCQLVLSKIHLISPIGLAKALTNFSKARRDPSSIYLPLEVFVNINEPKSVTPVTIPAVDTKAEKLQRHLDNEAMRSQTVEKESNKLSETEVSAKEVVSAPVRINLGTEFPEYNSDDKECPVKLLSGRHVHHQNYFVIFGKNLYSQFKSDQDYEKFKKIYDDGIVKTDKGQRGIIYCKGKGSSAFFKIKSPDTGIRVYGDLRKTIIDPVTGKSMHVIEFNRVKNKHP